MQEKKTILRLFMVISSSSIIRSHDTAVNSHGNRPLIRRDYTKSIKGEITTSVWTSN